MNTDEVREELRKLDQSWLLVGRKLITIFDVIEQLTRALLEIEWIKGCCPVCFSFETEGHSDDGCAINFALADVGLISREKRDAKRAELAR